MGYFNVLIVTIILFYQCFSQTISTTDDRFQSTQRKNVINSVLDSLINAIHPVEETQNQGGNFPINSNWELSDDQDTEENSDSLTNEITSTDESVEVSEVANESKDEDQEFGLPDDDLFREKEESENNKNIRPLIPSVIIDSNNPHQSLMVFKKSTRAPKSPKIKIKPKLNISQLLYLKSTTGQPSNQFAKDYYNSFSSTTLKKKGIEMVNSYLASKIPGVFHSTQPPIKPANGPDIWHKATTRSQYDLPIRTTRMPTANTFGTRSTRTINELINNNYGSVSGSPSTISDFDLNNMMSKINMLINMYNKTTQTKIESMTTIPYLKEKTVISSTNFKSTTSSYDKSNGRSKGYNYVIESGSDELDDKRNEIDENDYNTKMEMLMDIFQKWKAKKPQPTTQATQDFEDQNDMDKNSADEYEPVKLEMPIFIETHINPNELNTLREHQGFSIDEMISKMNGKIAGMTPTTPTTINTTPNNEKNINHFLSTKSKSSHTSHPTKRSKNGSNSRKQRTFGPISSEHTLTSLIGPMISSTELLDIDQIYNPVTFPEIYIRIPMKQKLSSTYSGSVGITSSIAPTIITEQTSAQTTESILNSFNQDYSSTEQDPMIKEFEQAASKISRKHKFPWPVNRQKHSKATNSMRSTTTSTNEQGESYDELFDEINNFESLGIKPIMSSPENIKTTTVKRESHKHHLKTKEPVLKSTIDGLTSTLWTKKPKLTPKIPTWLSHILSTIIPKTTTKIIDDSLETMVPLITELSDGGERGGEIGEKQNKPINSDKFNITDKPNWAIPERANNYMPQNQGGREGNYAGINSGQSLNGVGVYNGQAGIIIGENSGNGRKPQNRPPMLAKPIASYAYKPALLGE